MDLRAQRLEAVPERLVRMFGGQHRDKLQELVRTATSDSAKNVLLQNLKNSTRPEIVILRRGLAARSMAKAYETWCASMKLVRAKKM